MGTLPGIHGENPKLGTVEGSRGIVIKGVFIVQGGEESPLSEGER